MENLTTYNKWLKLKKSKGLQTKQMHLGQVKLKIDTLHITENFSVLDSNAEGGWWMCCKCGESNLNSNYRCDECNHIECSGCRAI
jgi:hypothetical protein